MVWKIIQGILLFTVLGIALVLGLFMDDYIGDDSPDEGSLTCLQE